MSARIPPEFIETVMHFTQPGQDGDIVTTMGWAGSSNDVQDDAGGIVDAMAELMGNLADSCIFNSLSVTVGQDGADDVTFELPTNTPGSSTGEALPPNNAILLQKRTGLGGRRGRGRSYLPGAVDSGVNEDGTLDGGYQNGVQANIADCISGMAAVGADGFTPVLLHQTAPFAPTDILTWLCQPKIATQRTRLR